ncbi:MULTISPECIES: FAD-dependent oxidoreductase [unclassified Streptomyces]|uniref:FAD-dependent oxidoreductase n=1 Tax=unclassified Streptomyces TaxID=2593676 RepID=UPI000379C481|nr:MULTISPECIES: NAD(P)-binding protein [unclassified Streptomyces]MYQ76798.1 NAD(P)-binding protein [Streptomyces sp. SID4923]
MAAHIGDRAVVLGGGIAGLFAARVLSESYHEVTVIDRDTLTGAYGPRSATPQGHHIHALLARGQQVMEELFPGITRELTACGVPVGDFGSSLSWYFNGQMIRRTETGLVCVAAGRARLEAHLRERVTALPGVSLVERTDILGLVTTGRERVVGVRIQEKTPGSAERSLAADVVVDTTGRGSRTPRWLEELGFGQVPQERVDMDLTYTTCDFEGPLPFDPIGDDIALIPVATPAMPRGAIFARMPDRYSLSLNGILGDKPPTDLEGFLRYARTLPVPEIYEAVKDAVPMGKPHTFHFPASVRRHYELLPDLPEGLVVLGDAACTFNPVYAQGMTVAALGAALLAEHLKVGSPPKPTAFQRDLAQVIDAPWMMAAGADLGFPGVQGLRTLEVRMGNGYMPKLQAAATADPTLSEAFLRAAGMIDPPQALMSPEIMGRVFAAG